MKIVQPLVQTWLAQLFLILEHCVTSTSAKTRDDFEWLVHDIFSINNARKKAQRNNVVRRVL